MIWRTESRPLPTFRTGKNALWGLNYSNYFNFFLKNTGYFTFSSYLCSVKIKEVLSALERFAPLPLQEREKIVDEAIRKGCNLIVSHHPLLFRGLKTISDLTDVQRTVMKAIREGICVISMHTNMDNAQGGVNYRIAQKLGLQNAGFFASKTVDGIEAGSGVIGELPEAMASDDFVIAVKKIFGVECAMCNELLRRPIRKVALCGGAGDFLLDEALKAGADAFITGEMHYHQYFGYEQQIQICVIGHYQSEQYTAEIFEEIIRQNCPGVKTEMAETCTNPILYL